MMTEEQTFEALIRTPFQTVFLYCTIDCRAGDEIGKKHEAYLIENGWTLLQFQQEVLDRRIGLDTVKLADGVWREQFRQGLVDR